ncbi:hypothetical protein [Myroides odoratus]|uniref:hypothetical protein n=1 Tax=Myroides odoratus TaxID=256 RepID=UPI0033427E9A
MRKIITYLVLCLFILTGCNNDDNTTYTKIKEEDKELLLGDWQLVNYRDFYDEIDLVKENIEVLYQFKKDGTATIRYLSSNKVEHHADYNFVTETKSLQYTFKSVRNFDNENLVEELIHLYTEEQNSGIKLRVDVSGDRMNLYRHVGDTYLGLTFIRVNLPQ